MWVLQKDLKIQNNPGNPSYGETVYKKGTSGIKLVYHNVDKDLKRLELQLCITNNNGETINTLRNAAVFIHEISSVSGIQNTTLNFDDFFPELTPDGLNILRGIDVDGDPLGTYITFD